MGKDRVKERKREEKKRKGKDGRKHPL